MSEYRNHAGRILSTLQSMAKHSGHVERKKLASIMQVTDEWSCILTAYSDLIEEYRLLEKSIKELTGNEVKQALHMSALPKIHKSICSWTFQVDNNTAHAAISGESLLALRYMAVEFPQETLIPENDLQAIRQKAEELRVEVENASRLSNRMREWLLDLIRTIRDSVDRYSIKGSRGVKKQISLLIGELAQNYSSAEEVKHTSPSIWSKFTEAFSLLSNIASVGEVCGAAIEYGQSLSPVARLLDLPLTEESSS